MKADHLYITKIYVVSAIGSGTNAFHSLLKCPTSSLCKLKRKTELSYRKTSPLTPAKSPAMKDLSPPSSRLFVIHL